jgi:uncharacterized protein YjdB
MRTNGAAAGTVLIVLALGLGACDDGGPTSVVDTAVATVEVTPATATLSVADTVRLTAVAKNAAGQVVDDAEVAWSSQATQFATVAPRSAGQARITGTGAGTTVITATAGGKSGEARVTVVNAAPTLESVEPGAVYAGSGPMTLVVRGTRFAPESRVYWNDVARATQFVSELELHVQVQAAETATADTVRIHVVTPAPGGGTSASLDFLIVDVPPTSPGPVATVTIDVDSLALDEGGTHQLAATAKDAAGTVLTGRYVQWTSSDPTIVAVSPLGQVTAVRPGTATVVARVDGASATAPVRVTLDYPYDLVYAGWAGVAGTGAQLFRTNPGDPEGVATPLGIAGEATNPSPSPDGSRIAYVTRTATALTLIRVADTDGSNVRDLVLSDDPNCGQLAWSPDGARIAFACRLDGSARDIWVMDPDGSNRVNLTSDPTAKQEWPAWSPVQAGGGYRIAYDHYVNGEPRIWTMKDDGTDRREVTAGMDSQASWSPDGTTIAFQRTSVATFGDIWLVDAVGGNERSLVGAWLAGPQFNPVWSPDGRFIAFSSSHESYGDPVSISQIFTVRLDGTLARRTSGSLVKYLPAWIVR